MDLMTKHDNERAQVESVDVNESMNEKPKKGFSFSFGIGYVLNCRKTDIFKFLIRKI